MQGFPPTPEARVTRENWNKAPFSSWSFWHTRRLFRSTPLKAGGGPEADLNTHHKARGFNFLIHHDDEEMTFPSWLKATHTDAMIIAHKGAVIFDYQSPGTPGINAPHMAFSITKSLTGVLAEILIHQGLINESALIADLIPALKETAFAKANLRQCLDMRDGVRFDEVYNNPDADIHTYSCAYWGPREGKPQRFGVYEALLGLKTQDSEPGAAFSYRTPVGDVVGWALSCATGKNLSDLIQENIWGRVGAKDEAYMIVDQAGHDIAGTGLNASCADLARIGVWLLDCARSSADTSALNKAVQAIVSPGSLSQLSGQGEPFRAPWAYRSLWWHMPELGAVAALGVFGQRLLIVPEEELVIVKLGSHPFASNAHTDPSHHDFLVKLLRELRS
jgi:CubicO group peptidase (beta-lactamase class C family)